MTSGTERELRERRRVLWLEARDVAQRSWQQNPWADTAKFAALMAEMDEIDRRLMRISRLRASENPVPLRVVMHGE